MTPDESAVRDVLESNSMEYNLREELHRNDRHVVYEATMDGTRVVCKCVVGDTEKKQASLDATLCRTLGGIDTIRTPDVVTASADVTVLTWLDGEIYDNGDTDTHRRTRIRALGRSLAQLHEATEGWFDGFGNPVPGGSHSVTVESPTAWGPCWRRLVDDWLARLDGTRDADLHDAIRQATRRADMAGLFDHVDPVLTHADAGPVNLRFGDSDEVGFLDWEGAMVFPGEYDLSRARLGWFDLPVAVEDDALRSELFEGYRAVRPLSPGSADRRRLYRATLTAKFVPGAVRAAEADVVDEAPETLREMLRAYVWEQLDRIDCIDSIDSIDSIDRIAE